MKILFISNQNSCRSQMAEAILRSFDKDLEIFSAGINPANHISPVAIEVLREIGIKLNPSEPQHYSLYKDLNFDYLITVCDGTTEELKIPKLNYRMKLHLGFHNPYKHFKDRDDLKQKCREIREEIYNELEYFYYYIIKKESSS